MSEKVGTLLACFRSESFSFKHRPGVPPSFRWKLCFLKKANLKFAKSDFQTNSSKKGVFGFALLG